jgi:transposase
VDAVEPAIRVLLAEFPEMSTSVILERVGWAHGRSVFYERVARLRPLFRPPDPASRTEYQPGELAQCDLWFPPVDVPLGFEQVGRPPVLVMGSGYSRIIAAVMLPSRQSPDLLAGHWELLSRWGRVPKALVWDNESAVGQWRAGKPRLTEAMNAFRGTLGINVVQCRPGDPEAKGLVERANGYLETSFLPGRSFTSPADFQHPAHRLARAGQPAPTPPAGVPPDRSLGPRSHRDAGATAGRAGHNSKARDTPSASHRRRVGRPPRRGPRRAAAT